MMSMSLGLLASLTLVFDASARVFVPTNSTWRYFKGTSEASSPTNAWRELDFDDSAWLVGAAPFHFGTNAVGGDDKLIEGTILSDMRSNYTCLFLRQSFVLPDTNNVRGLWLNAWYDDGLAIWINGQAARTPLSVSGLAYTNTATTSREGSTRNALALSSAIGLLRAGTNVLCLQVFNRSLTDDDFRIDVELAETTPTFALAAAYTVSENEAQLGVRVVGTGALDPGATVDYATTNLTAIAGLDYTAVAGTLAFAPGETNQTIMVPILNEGFVEGTKTFQVILRNPSNAVLGTPATATVSITDNDVGVQFVFATYSVAEDAGVALVGVVRGDDGTLPVTVDLATTDLTAISGLDYTGTTTTLSFAGTERFKLVPIPILNDGVKEANRTFLVSLSNPTGATLGNQKTTTVTIVDNDQGFQFEAASYTVAEDAGVALITVLRGNDDTNAAVTVDYATTDGTATNGVDYTGANGTLSFAPAEKAKVLRLPILNGGFSEATKTFGVTLSNPTGGFGLGPLTTTTVSILDNDPGVGFELATDSVFEKAGQITLTVLRGNDGALGPITVDYATADGTARAGTDYQAVSGTLEFQENETVKSLTVPILADTVAENTETFSVTLSHPTGGAVLGRASISVQILDNYCTVVPPYDAGLTIRREAGVNWLTWTGDGILQRADRVTGPWQTLAGMRSPVAVQSPLPVAFYRIKGSRPVNLYVPSGYDGQTPVPLVILLHGRGESGQQEEDYMRLRPLAEARRFLYCYPDATLDLFGAHQWNAFFSDPTDAAAFGFRNVDDIGYLRGLVNEVARHFALDRKRVYLIGHSNGGFMSYRMACESADLIAGIASLAGTRVLDYRNCAPSQSVNILQIHGTADGMVPYWGGALTSLNFPWNSPALSGALRQAETWAGYNGASNPVTDPAPSMDLSLDVAGLDTVLTRYTTCPAGGAVELWTINGGSHVPTLSSEFAPHVIDWLLAHPKP